MAQIQYKKDHLKSKDIKTPSRTLKFLRALAMVFKVISMVVFVLAIIGSALFATFSIVAIAGKDIFVTQTLTLETWISQNWSMTVYSASFASLMLAIATGGWVALGWLSWLYFGKNWKDKTPYTFRSARDLMRLMIVAAGCAIVTGVLFGIIFAIYYVNFGTQVKPCGYTGFGLIIVALVYLIFSFVVRHATEVRELLVKECAYVRNLLRKIAKLNEELEDLEKQLNKERRLHNKFAKKSALFLKEKMRVRSEIAILNKEIVRLKKILSKNRIKSI